MHAVGPQSVRSHLVPKRISTRPQYIQKEDERGVGWGCIFACNGYAPRYTHGISMNIYFIQMAHLYINEVHVGELRLPIPSLFLLVCIRANKIQVYIGLDILFYSGSTES